MLSFRVVDAMSRAIESRRMRFVVIAFVLLLASPAAAAPECGKADLGSARVAAVRDGRTLLLKDGRELRLAGIEAAPAGAALLRRLTQDNVVHLRGAPAAKDRYGRTVGFATPGGTSESLQEALLAAGAARVSAHLEDLACAEHLLTVERTAREARTGLWADPNFAPLRAELGPALDTQRGKFVLVEGKVLSVREVGGTVYVNFGRRWTRDFTLIIPRRLGRDFAAAGLEPEALAGRRVRVRGWLERRGGPIVEATALGQIEVLP
jgi:endonuclease YncB( thermonuclease family)